MKSFRRGVQRSRVFILCLLLTEMFYLVDGRNFVHAYQEHEAKEERLEEISERLGIPVDDLRPERLSPLERLNKFLGETPEDPVKIAGRKRLHDLLKQQAEQVANNPYRPEMEVVQQGHQIYRVEGHLNELLQLTAPADKGLGEGSQKALMRNLHYGLFRGLELPDVKDGLSATAQARHEAMQSNLDRLTRAVRPVIAEAQGAETQAAETSNTKQGSTPSGTTAQKVEQLRLTAGVDLSRPQRAPRFAERPLPNRLVTEKAKTLDRAAMPAAEAPSPLLKAPPAKIDAVKIAQAAKSVATPLAAKANEFEGSPAQMLRFVREEIAVDWKWGASKSTAGTLEERRGTSWDQAMLLQELLLASGVDARLEWGEVEITADQLRNLTGLDDAWRAGDLLTTAGNPVVLITAGSQVVAARMQHVWVRAWLDYVPNRGATSGPGDRWIVMDPYLVSTEWTDGLRVHEQVPFTLEDYLLSGSAASPRRTYEDALWSYIRDNDIACTTLEQLKPSGSVVAESLPFVPGTLKAKVIRLDGQSATAPEAMQARLSMQLRTVQGESLATWSSPWPAVYGQRLELAWPGATSDDQDTLDAYGGVFETPPYLVELAPEIRLDGGVQLRGSGVTSATDIELEVTLQPVVGPPSISLFQMAAGERAVFALDLGQTPQQHIDRHRQELALATDQGDSNRQEAATLALLGSQYLHNLARDLNDLSGWKRQRLLQLGTLGMTLQTGRVGTNVEGVPLSFEKDSLVVDIATMPLGLFPVDSDRQYEAASLELLGSQSSYLEGALFDEVVADEGISAVAFLTRAVRQGQTLHRLDATNVDSVLDTVDLGAGVEASIRAGVAQGKIAWVPEEQLTVNLWRGAGYILEDPSTGAAGYLATGGYGAGAGTGKGLADLKGLLGSEVWLGTIFGELFGWLLDLLGGSDTEGPTTIVSDPINLANGNMIRRTTDLQLPARGLPIEWSRTYNSRSDRVGVFGHGWTFTYGESLESQPDGAILYIEEDGTEHLFTSDGQGGWTAPPGKHLTLTAEGGGHALRTKDGLFLNFNAAGKLASVVDREGNTLSLVYDASGNLQHVVDAAGRQALTITMANGRVTQIEDLVNRTVTYGYTGDDLTSVTDVAGKTWQLEYDDGHNLVAVVDPLSHRDTFAYDSEDRCVQHVDVLGEVETFAYTRHGERAIMTDRRGYSSYLEMDARGRATLHSDPLGNATQVTWNEGNNRTSIVDPRGGVSSRTWDEQGNMLSASNAQGETTTYAYEPVYNQMTQSVDALGNEVTLTYEGPGRLKERRQTVDGETIVESFTYDAFGRIAQQIDAAGNASTMVYAADPQQDNGMFVQQIDVLGNATSYATDAAGRIGSITDPEGNVSIANVDSRGNLTDMTDWFGNTTQLTYDDLGRSSTMSNAQGTRVLTYDARGQVVESTDVEGNQSQTIFDPAGNVLAQNDANGNQSMSFYDALGRRSAVLDPTGGVWTFGFCNELGQSSQGCSSGGCGGNSTATFCDLTNPLGQTVKREIDALGRIVRAEDPLGNTVAMEYDALGRQTSMTDGLGKTTSYGYDARNRLTSVTEADGVVTQYTYDERGNMVERTDGEGRIWQMAYDDLGRMASKTDPLGHTTTMTYDSLGNPFSQTDANGNQLTFRNVLGLMKAIEDASGQTLHSWDHDSQGRVRSVSNADVDLEYTYDPSGRPLQVINQTLNETVEYSYDAAGNRTAMTGPQGTVEYLYDARNRMVEMRDPKTGTYRFDYDSLSRRTQLAYPNGVTTSYTYDAGGRLERQITRDSFNTIVDGNAYTYNARNQQVAQVSLRDGIEAQYTYDDRQRLVHWQRADRFETYTYDDVGNRLTLQDNLGSVAYVYDDSDRLLSETRTWLSGETTQTAYTWDANGNQLSKVTDGEATSYTWDPLNRLAELQTPETSVSFGYDPSGVRVRRTTATKDERFLHDYYAPGGYERVLEVSQQSGSSEYFTHGPKVDEVLGRSVDFTPTFDYRDRRQSLTSVGDDAGAVTSRVSYAPFGQAEGVGGSRFTYTGREAEEGGLMYYRARYMQPDTGRFLSRDLIQGVLGRPASQNAYGYVEGDPVGNTDPSGLIAARAFGLSFIIAGYLGLKASFDYMAAETVALEQTAGKKYPATLGGVGKASYLATAMFVWGLNVLSIVAYFVVYVLVGAMFWTRSGKATGLPDPKTGILQVATALEFAGGLAMVQGASLAAACATALRIVGLSQEFSLEGFVGAFMGGCIVGSIVAAAAFLRRS